MIVTESKNRKIKICDQILEEIYSQIQKNDYDPEKGGIIVGRENLNNENIILEYISKPLKNDICTRTRYTRKDEGHLKYFEKLYNENNGVYAYWGEWHTHPEDIPHYSIIDLKNWKRIGKEDPKGVQYHIIAGRKAFSIWRMQKGKLCPKKICEVKWNEIIYERIKNNIRPILQLLLLVGVFFAPRIFKITELIKTPPKLEASQKICDYIFYFAWKGGDWAIGVFFLIVVLFIIRKWNKTYMFNRGNYYKQYRYGWYRICSKILGYSECNLIQVPIYMQFKLVLNDTFDKYNCGEFDKKENDTISVSKSNFSHETDEVNVMISDTYPLSLSQLPEIKKNIPTLLISRNNTNDVNRYDSPELVRCVVNEVRSLNNNIKKVNVYATTNPLNTKNIASSAFKLGGRDNFNEVRVFQQERDGIRKFNNKGIVVYKR